MAVTAEGDFLAGFLADDPDQPVVMLNLLRFAEGGRALLPAVFESLRRDRRPALRRRGRLRRRRRGPARG